MRTNTARFTAAATATALTGVAAGVLGISTTASAASTALPIVTKLSASAITNAVATSTVVVTGKNFTGVTATGVTVSPAPTGTGATWVAPAVKVISDTQLVVTFQTTGAALNAASGSQLIVTNPKGASANTAADNLSIHVPLTAGTVAANTLLNPLGKSVVRVTGLAAGLGTTAALFAPKKITATVDGEAASVKWVSDTSVDVTTPAGTPSNTAPNLVLSREGVPGAANTTAKYAAIITKLSATSGPLAGGSEVTVTGKGFTGATAWLFGAVTATCTVNTDVKATCTVPVASAAGAVSVSFTPASSTPYGTSAGATYSYTNI